MSHGAAGGQSATAPGKHHHPPTARRGLRHPPASTGTALDKRPGSTPKPVGGNPIGLRVEAPRGTRDPPPTRDTGRGPAARARRRPWTTPRRSGRERHAPCGIKRSHGGRDERRRPVLRPSSRRRRTGTRTGRPRGACTACRWGWPGRPSRCARSRPRTALRPESASPGASGT